MKLSVWASHVVAALLIIMLIVMVASAMTARWDRATFFLLLSWIVIEGIEPHEDFYKDINKKAVNLNKEPKGKQ